MIMKKWNMISLILIASLLSLAAFAADPDPQPTQDDQQAQMTDEQKEALTAQQEAQQEALEAQKEAQEEAAEAQKEAMEDAKEAQDDAKEAQDDIRQAMLEAQQGWQEGMKEARKGLAEAQKQLRQSGINISLPRMAGTSFGMSASGSSAGKTESVVLIPDKPMDTKIMGQLTEDIQVMAIILEEKATADQNASGQGGSGSAIGTSTGTGWMSFNIFGSGSSGVKTMYLGGYGIIFTLDVDFPLVLIKGAEEKPQVSQAEKKDEVWQRSKSKLKGEDKTVEKDKDKAPALVFDQDKVKQLQKDLTAALKHAANIRNMEPREKIVIVVRSVIDGEVLSRQIMEGAEKTEKEPVSIPTSVMTLRADKQDIDAFAADKIDLDKFTGKVSVITY
jgi:hypothetical protein